MIDKYFNRIYNAANYNCAHLVCEYWGDRFGSDMREVLSAYLTSQDNRRSIFSVLKNIVLLDAPINPCVVLFQASKRATHVGVWHNGKVLHIGPKQGVQYQPLEVVRLGFSRTRFFTCK